MYSISNMAYSRLFMCHFPISIMSPVSCKQRSFTNKSSNLYINCLELNTLNIYKFTAWIKFYEIFCLPSLT